MAVLCGMPTMQYSVGSGPLSVHKLFTFCIRWCLVSRACDWVMLALSAVLLIFSFQFSLFSSISVARQHSGVRGLPNIGHRALPKIWEVRVLYGAYTPEKWFWMESIESNRGSFGAEFSAICNHCVVVNYDGVTLNCGEEFSRFFLEKTMPLIALTLKFSKFCYEIFIATPIKVVVFKYRKICPTGNWWKLALFV